jgi:tripartite-type tricarboxylate transporter receptor subunit TctC
MAMIANLSKRISLSMILATCCVLAVIKPASAQPYPNRPIKAIVPFPAGGGTDATARIVAEHLSRALGETVIIENRGGAGGVVGAEAVARSAADGYTILITSDSITSVPHVLKTTIDPTRDLLPVIQLTRQPVVLAVHPSLRVSSVAELIALAKQRSGMRYATSGLASPQSIAPLWFGQVAGITLTPVPYRGGGPAMNDLIAGHVKIGSIGSAPLVPHYKVGNVRLLAQTSEARSPSLPDVPTYQEAGVKGLVIDQWFGVFAPAATPAAIVARLNTEIGNILINPSIREKLLQAAQEPVGASAAQFERLVSTDYEKYRRLTADLNIKAE